MKAEIEAVELALDVMRRAEAGPMWLDAAAAALEQTAATLRARARGTGQASAAAVSAKLARIEGLVGELAGRMGA